MSPQWHKQYDNLMLLLLVLTLFLFAMYLFRGCSIIGCGGVQVDRDSNPADCPAAFEHTGFSVGVWLGS